MAAAGAVAAEAVCCAGAGSDGSGFCGVVRVGGSGIGMVDSDNRIQVPPGTSTGRGGGGGGPLWDGVGGD